MSKDITKEILLKAGLVEKDGMLGFSTETDGRKRIIVVALDGTDDSELTPREVEINEVEEKIKCILEWAGAHPKSPWVSAKERMPSVERDLFGDATHPSVLVLTASHAGSVSVNRWNGREWLYTGDVDYWMPIPKLPKGGDV